MKKSFGRPKLPRDAAGKVIGKNYKPPKITTKAVINEPVKIAPVHIADKPVAPPRATGNDFKDSIAAAKEKIAEEARALAPKPPAVPSANILVDPNEPKVGDNDFTEIIAEGWTMVGDILVHKTEIPEMQFTDKENSKLSKATNDILNLMFPDLAALSSKEKAILVSALIIMNVGKSKLNIYQEHQKKIKAPKPTEPVTLEVA